MLLKSKKVWVAGSSLWVLLLLASRLPALAGLYATPRHPAPPKRKVGVYRVRVVHDMLTDNCFRYALACDTTCAQCAECGHDTLTRGPVPGTLVYSISNAPLPGRPDSYQRRLHRLLRGLLRQDYLRDSTYFAPTAAAYPVPASERILPIPWSQSSVLNVTLLITPQRDSLVAVQIERARGQGETAYASADSSYCFRLRAGHPQLISARRYDSVQRERYTLEHRLLVARGAWLAARARPRLQQTWLAKRLIIHRVRFTSKGVSVTYGRMNAGGEPLDGRLEATLPYQGLPAALFTFP